MWAVDQSLMDDLREQLVSGLDVYKVNIQLEKEEVRSDAAKGTIGNFLTGEMQRCERFISDIDQGRTVLISEALVMVIKLYALRKRTKGAGIPEAFMDLMERVILANDIARNNMTQKVIKTALYQ